MFAFTQPNYPGYVHLFSLGKSLFFLKKSTTGLNLLKRVGSKPNTPN